MKVSVIIPSYKPQEYIWDCLKSLYNQTLDYNDYEVILILNGCREPYEEEILSFKLEHPELNLVYLQTDYGNVSNARNIGIDIFKGEYVTFIDDDDFVSPSYLEELYDNASPDIISLSNAYAFKDGKLDIQLPYRITDAYNYCVTNNINSLNSPIRHYFSGPWMKLIPRSYVEGKRFDEKFLKSQDSVYMFLISNKIKKLSFTSESAVYYRRYRKNSAVTKKRTLKWLFQHSSMLFKAYAQIYSKGGYSTRFYITRNLAVIKTFFIMLKSNVIGKW